MGEEDQTRAKPTADVDLLCTGMHLIRFTRNQKIHCGARVCKWVDGSGFTVKQGQGRPQPSNRSDLVIFSDSKWIYTD